MENNIIKISDTIKTKQDANGNLITRNVTVTEHGDFEVSNGDLNINDLGIVKIANTTASTSSSTGALQVAGGIGVGANSYFGGTVTLDNVLLQSKDDGSLNISPDVNNVAGKINLYPSGTSKSSWFNWFNSSDTSNNQYLNISAGSTYHSINSYYTGSENYKPIQIKCDLSSIYLANSGYIGINNTSPNYALDVNGSVDISGNLYVADTSKFANRTILSSYGIGIGVSPSNDGNFLTVGSGGTVKIANTTASTSSSTGALQVSGGIGVGGDGNFGGGLTATQGNFGGIGVGGNISISGNSRRIIANLSTSNHSNRLLFQDSGSSQARLGLLPNGNEDSAFVAYNNSTPTASSCVLFGINANTAYIHNQVESNGNIDFQINDSSKVTINSSGDISVKGNISTSGNIVGKFGYSNASTTPFSGISLVKSSTTSSNVTSLVFVPPNENASGESEIRLYEKWISSDMLNINPRFAISKSSTGCEIKSVSGTASGNSADDIIFYLNNNTTNVNKTPITIKGGSGSNFGYVGINNTNPDYELDVLGAAFISGNAYVGGKLTCSVGNIISTITGLINIINNQPWGTSAMWKND